MKDFPKITIVAIIALVFGIASSHYFLKTYNVFDAKNQKELPSSIIDLDGNELINKEVVSSVLLINFWATSCSTCVEEMPHFIDLYHEYKIKGIKIIALAMDYDQIQLIRKFKEDKEIPFNVAHDTKGEIATRYKVAATPTTILFNQGKIQNLWIGPIKDNDIRKAIEEII